MNKMMKAFQKSLKRILNANLSMEHYWFYPKAMVIPVEVKKTHVVTKAKQEALV